MTNLLTFIRIMDTSNVVLAHFHTKANRGYYHETCLEKIGLIQLICITQYWPMRLQKQKHAKSMQKPCKDLPPQAPPFSPLPFPPSSHPSRPLFSSRPLSSPDSNRAFVGLPLGSRRFGLGADEWVGVFRFPHRLSLSLPLGLPSGILLLLGSLFLGENQ